VGDLVRYRSVVADSVRWEGFRFRPDDVVISTPPKCGTTWMQMLVGLVVFDTADFYRPLAEISLWLDMQLADRGDVVARLDAQEHRRFIKTHTPLDGLPWDERVTYICVGRDPRDVAVSSAHHMANLDFEQFMARRQAAVGLDDLPELGMAPPGDDSPPTFPSPAEQLSGWIEAQETTTSLMSLTYTVHHLKTFWERRQEPNIALFHYSDLLADLPGQLRRLADVLGIAMSDERLRELAEAATFQGMKDRAAMTAPNADISLWRDHVEFFHRGTNGQWRDAFGPDELRRYDDRVAELAPTDLAAWMHNGWLAAPANA
jgi:hypothetical protein